MDELIKYMTLEMLPDGLYRQIAEEIGIENFYRLTKLVGGESIYIIKPDSFVRPDRDIRIKAEFNGYNHTELAKKYGVTERWVRQLCGEGAPPGQMDLFDFIGGENKPE